MNDTASFPYSLEPPTPIRSINAPKPPVYQASPPAKEGRVTDAQRSQRAPFTITPKAVRQFARDKRDGDITQVYATLADYANADGVCWPSQATIAKEAGVSERKVRDVLKLLHDGGFIRSEHGQHRNTYTLIDEFPDDPTRQDLPTEDISTRQDLPLTRQSVPVTRQESTPHSAGNDPLTRYREQDPVEPDPVKPDSYSARTNEIVRWFAKRVGGVVSKPGSKPWDAAHDLAEAGATDADLEGAFTWLQGEAWVKSISLVLIASKFNDYKSRHATPIKPVDDENPKLKSGPGRMLAQERKYLVQKHKYTLDDMTRESSARRIAEIDVELPDHGITVQEAETWAQRH